MLAKHTIAPPFCRSIYATDWEDAKHYAEKHKAVKLCTEKKVVVACEKLGGSQAKEIAICHEFYKYEKTMHTTRNVTQLRRKQPHD